LARLGLDLWRFGLGGSGNGLSNGFGVFDFEYCQQQGNFSHGVFHTFISLNEEGTRASAAARNLKQQRFIHGQLIHYFMNEAVRPRTLMRPPVLFAHRVFWA